MEKQELVEIDYDEVLQYSASATHFQIDDEIDVWIPLSTMREHDKKFKTFTISEALATRKGLI